MIPPQHEPSQHGLPQHDLPQHDLSQNDPQQYDSPRLKYSDIKVSLLELPNEILQKIVDFATIDATITKSTSHYYNCKVAYSLILSCKTLSSFGVDALWYRVNGMTAILNLLPPHYWALQHQNAGGQYVKLDRFPDTEAWNRFHNYLEKIRVLVIDSQGSLPFLAKAQICKTWTQRNNYDLHPETLSILCGIQGNRPLLPNLGTLKLSCTARYLPLAISLARTKSLVSIFISSKLFSSTISGQAFLKQIASLNSPLVEFEFELGHETWIEGSMEEAIAPQLLEISKIPTLKSFICGDNLRFGTVYDPGWPTIYMLGLDRNITHLRIAVRQQPPAPAHNAKLFPRLSMLDIGGPLDCLLPFLETLASGIVTECYINMISPSQLQWESLVKCVGKLMNPSPQHLEFDCSQTLDNVNLNPRVITELRPLKGLAVLHLECKLDPHQVDQKFLSDIADCFPYIENLWVTGKSSITLGDITQLSEQCLYLTEVGVHFDLKGAVFRGITGLERQLSSLIPLGKSMPQGDYITAFLLAQLFPRLQYLHKGGLDRLDTNWQGVQTILNSLPA
jgi:hypothetical protein